MKVSFRLTRRDILAVSFYQLLKEPVILGFLGVLFVYGTYRNWRAIPQNHAIVVKTITFIILELIPIAIFCGVLILLISLMSLSRMNKTILTDHNVTLNENSIISETQKSHSEVNWSAIQRLVRTRAYLFMYISRFGALPIPRRAFDSQNRWDEFCDFCKTRTKTAKELN